MSSMSSSHNSLRLSPFSRIHRSYCDKKMRSGEISESPAWYQSLNEKFKVIIGVCGRVEWPNLSSGSATCGRRIGRTYRSNRGGGKSIFESARECPDIEIQADTGPMGWSSLQARNGNSQVIYDRRFTDRENNSWSRKVPKYRRIYMENMNIR